MLELYTFCFSFFFSFSFLISQVLREAQYPHLGCVHQGAQRAVAAQGWVWSCGPRGGSREHCKDTGEHPGSAPAPPSAFLVLFSLLSFGFREMVAQKAGSCFCCPGGWAWLPPSSWRLHCPSPGGSLVSNGSSGTNGGQEEMPPAAPICRDLGEGAAEPLQPVFANKVLLEHSHAHCLHTHPQS